MLEEWKEFYIRVKYRGREPEEIINIQIVKWLRENYPGLLFWHTPSEGKRHPLTQLRNKLLGVVSGVPDIFIPMAVSKFIEPGHPWDRKGFFCELKAGKNKPTTSQKEMMQKLTELGYYCCVCYSLEEFIKEWGDYVKT